MYTWVNQSLLILPAPHSQASGTGLTTPASPSVDIQEIMNDDICAIGTRFTAVLAMGPSSTASEDDEVCWMGLGGLGKAGIFDGDWVSRANRSGY